MIRPAGSVEGFAVFEEFENFPLSYAKTWVRSRN